MNRQSTEEQRDETDDEVSAMEHFSCEDKTNYIRFLFPPLKNIKSITFY